jgi:flagellin-like protein
MKSITPVISVILLILMTIIASASAYFFISSAVFDLESQGNLETFPGNDNSRLNLVSITGTTVAVRNDGSSPVVTASVFINNEWLNYTLDSPILSGEIRDITFNARKAGEDLRIKIIYNSKKILEGVSFAGKNTEDAGFTDDPQFLNENNIDDSSMEYCLLNSSNNVWFGGTTTGNRGGCCGDDGISDNFYNSSIGIANYFCVNGSLSREMIDFNKTICEHYSYTWMINANYPATYSFTGENAGSTPAGFSIGQDTLDNSFLNISDALDNHYKIANISWIADASGIEIWNKTTSVSSGIHNISWWIRNSVLHRNSLNQDSGAGIVLANSDASESLAVWHDANNGDNAVIIYNGTVLDGALDILPDVWYQYSLSMDLDNDYCNLSRNGEILNDFYGNPLIYYKLPSGFEIEKFGFFITNGDPRDNAYIDGIELSWESSNNNFVPACCGDDGAIDNFSNSTHQCAGGVFSAI